AIVAVFAVFALAVPFVFDNYSSMAVQRLSISRCELPYFFEQQFSSKNDCIRALPGLCAENCFGDVGDCIDLGKRSCSNVGRRIN
ncbi:hypothetical protein HY484_01440, partial [Candidatus Woesearchaeota archaeon]|nr:hypothetical protein [Candidatus Woesearchaeota archaeon]